ncbi:2-oxo acid dehydrogenase subunit E2 [Microbacterium sp. B2969]|uniref:2-oxo acid dehydrogenase subunit E2 n=1 Tax=Microbacterium alkaliflavum TaxID=3248839 RepID=A0ABW7QCI5_9MICO
MSVPGYVVSRVPSNRRPVLDRLVGASRRFQVHALVEFDVSEASARIAQAEPHVSWTGFLIATLGRALARHPEVNSRKAGNRILTFDRVDVGATVERHWTGQTILDIATVRDVNRMSASAVSALLRETKYGPGESHSPHGMMRLVLRLPGPLRRTAIRLGGTRPSIAASFGPAVGVTSLGMFTRGWGWAIPVAPLTVIVSVGGVVDRPVVRDGKVVVRPMLPLTLSFDHAVVDGAPAARFTETLRELVESAAVLEIAPAAEG